MRIHNPRPDELSLGQTTARPAPWMWACLLICIVAAGFTGQFVWSSYVLLQSARTTHDEDQKRLNQQKVLQRQLQIQDTSPVMLARRKAAQALYARQHLSWEGLFDSLEIAADRVDGGVSLISASPTVTTDNLEIQITATALNERFMLAWMEALRTDMRVRSIEPVTQQADDKSPTPGVVRFQAVLTLDPTVEVPHPSRPLFTPSPLPPAPGTPGGAAAVLPMGGRK